MNNKEMICVDTDAGHDDVLALILLIKSKLFNILQITTVAGNSTITNATRNARYTLELLSETDIPVYSGAKKPLKRELVQAVVHGKSGLDGVDTSNINANLTNDAVEKTAQLILDNPNQITLLTLGPLTNIAKLMIEHPEVVRYIKQVVMMGGAIDVCGNKNRVAEFNMFVDPEAADVVFRSTAKKVLIPLDPCNSVVLKNKDFSKVGDAKLKKNLMNMMNAFIKGVKIEEGVNGALVYDALAAYFFINREAFQLIDMDIVIEITGEHTSGMTVVEKRSTKTKNYNVEVAVGIDEKAFRKDLEKFLSV